MSYYMIVGQYVPGTSFIHRLDPRAKLLIIFFYVIFVFFANNVWIYALLTLFVLVTIISTFIPLRFIEKGVLPVWFLIFFTFLFHLFLADEVPVVFEFGSFLIMYDCIHMGLVITLRFLFLILMTSLLTLTTTQIEIKDATERLLHHLIKVKFPVHELAIMMSISLR